MTAWSAPFADGWKAEQNALGDLGCGGGGTRTDPPIVRLVSADRQTIDVVGPGRPVGWLTNDLFAYLPVEPAGELWVASRSRGTNWSIAAHANGNTVTAADDHWLSVTVFSDATGYVVYDGRGIAAGALYDGGAVAGERMVYVVPGGQDGAPHVQELVNGQLARLVRIPVGGNALTLSADGYIGAGYNGESYLLRPGKVAFDIVTVTPWRQEGPPVIAAGPNNMPWLWTATTSPGKRPLVLGRPDGETNCIVLDLVAAWLRARLINGQWSIVAVDGGGQLRTMTVAADTPRVPVPKDVLIPPPPPDPPARPTITIPMYGPTEGPAPHTWQATATTTGIVDRIVWRWRHLGTTPWTMKDDDEHTTVTFTDRGIYEIGVDAYGPGGHDGTAVKRLITVT